MCTVTCFESKTSSNCDGMFLISMEVRHGEIKLGTGNALPLGDGEQMWRQCSPRLATAQYTPEVR
jgi:hypothetical protein